MIFFLKVSETLSLCKIAVHEQVAFAFEPPAAILSSFAVSTWALQCDRYLWNWAAWRARLKDAHWSPEVFSFLWHTSKVLKISLFPHCLCKALDRNVFDLWSMERIYKANKIWDRMTPTKLWSKFTCYNVGGSLQQDRGPAERYLVCMPELPFVRKCGCSPMFCPDMQWECNQMCTKRPGLWDTLGNASTLSCG